VPSPDTARLENWLLAARVLADQGLVEWRTGEFDRSLADSLRAAELYQANDSGSATEAAYALDAAGLAARDLGRAEDAVELSRRAETVFDSLYGPTAQESTLKAREHVGAALVAANRLDEARPILESVLALREEALGSQHPNLGEICGYLAELHLAAGEYEAAAGYAERVRRVYVAVYGPDHAYTRQADSLAARIDVARTSGRTP